MHTRVREISDDGHQLFVFVQVISTADNRTEGLHVLLRASSSRH